MEILFWLMIALIIYTYVGYPALLYIVSLVINKRIEQRSFEPTVTFLITAYNEEKGIEQKLLNTLSLDYPREKLEIIVASDGSTDRTDEIVRSFSDRNVRLIRVEGRVGKTETQNRAVQSASGEIVLFSDATTNYETQSIRMIVRNYADTKVGAVSGRYRYLDPNSTNVGKGSIAFWDYENFIKSRQNKIRTITGCCGCIYSVRRHLYAPLPRDIISDLVEPLKILEKGYRIVFEPDAIAYETACERTREELKMRVRVISRGMNGLLFIKSLFNPFAYGSISFQLFSHKVLRWFIWVFCIFLYISNIFLIQRHIFYFLFWVLQSAFYAAALIGLLAEKSGRKIKYFSYPLFFCIVNYASLVAFIKTIRQKKAILWETVRP